MEQLEYNLLFRWFVGLGMDAEVWEATVFSKNRERLIAGEVARSSCGGREQAERAELLSDEHFTVDGTLIEAWASRRSYERKPDSAGAGTGARVVSCCATRRVEDGSRRRGCSSAAGGRGQAQLSGTRDYGKPPWVGGGSDGDGIGAAAEREAALSMLRKLRRRGPATLEADKAYQEERFVAALRSKTSAPRGRVCAFEELAELVEARRTRTCRFRSKSAETQTGGAGVWLDQSDGGLKQPSYEASAEWIDVSSAATAYNRFACEGCGDSSVNQEATLPRQQPASQGEQLGTKIAENQIRDRERRKFDRLEQPV